MSQKFKNILVTGSAGFLGSHLSEKLSDMGHNVVGIDKSKIELHLDISPSHKDTRTSKDRLIQIYNGKQLIGVTTSLGKNGRVNSNQIENIKFSEVHKKSFNLNQREEIIKIIPLIEEKTFDY